MFAQLKIQGIESDDSRDGARYQTRGHGRFSADNAAPVACDVLNVSHSGAAVKCYGSLRVGATYRFEIVGLGAFPCRVVRNFDANNYGVTFEISLEGKLRLRRHLEGMFNDAATAAGGASPAAAASAAATSGRESATRPTASVIVAPDAHAAIDDARRLAAARGANVLIVEDGAISTPDGHRTERVLVTGATSQAVRDWITGRANPATIVITGEVSLSFNCLKAGAVVLDPKGREFSGEQADQPAGLGVGGFGEVLGRAMERLGAR